MLNRKLLPALTTVAFVALGGFSSQVFAADAATSASVDIVTPISITTVTDIDFGVVIPDPLVVGTILLPSNTGVAAASGGTTQHQAGTEVRGRFTISGTANQAYSITDPGTINLGAANLDATSWTATNDNGDCINDPVTTCTTTPTLDGSGADGLYIGASLNVPIGIAEGQYSANFNLTVEYQ